jgi:hypothetical protein
MEEIGESGLEVGGGTTVTESSTDSVCIGEDPEGVDACSVANKSGEEEGGVRPRLQARRKKSATKIQSSLFLVVVQFN